MWYISIMLIIRLSLCVNQNQYDESVLIHMVGSYFIYDIAYSKPLQSLLLMIQYYVFGLQDLQNNTPVVIEIMIILRKMDSTL